MWLLVTAGGGRVVMRERRAVVLVRDPEACVLTASCCVCTFLASTLFPLSLDFFLRVHFLGDQSINALGSTLRSPGASTFQGSLFLVYFYFLAKFQISPIEYGFDDVPSRERSGSRTQE